MARALLRTPGAAGKTAPWTPPPRRGSVADLWPGMGTREHQIRLDALDPRGNGLRRRRTAQGAEAAVDELRAWLGQRRAPVTAISPSSRRPAARAMPLSAALDWWRARVG